MKADPYLCPGHLTNGWTIHRDCIDCTLYRNPIGAKDVYWMAPPAQMPCDKRQPRQDHE